MLAWDTGRVLLGPGVALTHTSKTLFLQKGGTEFFPSVKWHLQCGTGEDQTFLSDCRPKFVV